MNFIWLGMIVVFFLVSCLYFYIEIIKLRRIYREGHKIVWYKYMKLRACLCTILLGIACTLGSQIYTFYGYQLSICMGAFFGIGAIGCLFDAIFYLRRVLHGMDK